MPIPPHPAGWGGVRRFIIHDSGTQIQGRPRRGKVRFCSGGLSGPHPHRSLAPPLQTEPAAAGLRFGFLFFFGVLPGTVCRGDLWSPAGVRSTPLRGETTGERSSPLRDDHRRCGCRGDHVGAKSAFAPAAYPAPIRIAPLPLLSKPNPLPLGFGLGFCSFSASFRERSVGATCGRPRACEARPYGGKQRASAARPYGMTIDGAAVGATTSGQSPLLLRRPIRPPSASLPCPSSPNRTRCRWASVWVFVLFQRPSGNGL